MSSSNLPRFDSVNFAMRDDLKLDRALSVFSLRSQWRGPVSPYFWNAPLSKWGGSRIIHTSFPAKFGFDDWELWADGAAEAGMEATFPYFDSGGGGHSEEEATAGDGMGEGQTPPSNCPPDPSISIPASLETPSEDGDDSLPTPSLSFDRDPSKGKAPAFYTGESSSNSGWGMKQGEGELIPPAEPIADRAQDGWPAPEECVDWRGPPGILPQPGVELTWAETPIAPVHNDPAVVAIYSLLSDIALCEQIIYDHGNTVSMVCDPDDYTQVREHFPQLADEMDRLRTLQEKLHEQIIARVLEVRKK